MDASASRAAIIGIDRIVPRFDHPLAGSFIAVDHAEALKNLLEASTLLMLALASA